MIYKSWHQKRSKSILSHLFTCLFDKIRTIFGAYNVDTFRQKQKLLKLLINAEWSCTKARLRPAFG